MDMKQYKTTKSSGGVTVARVTADTAVVSMRRFDPANGVELDPGIDQFSIKELKSQRDVISGQLEMINEFIDDLEKSEIIGAVKK